MVVDINNTIATISSNAALPPALESLAQTVGRFFGTLSLFVGGIFGIYLILIFLRWKEARDLKRLLTEIRDDLKILIHKKKKK